MNERLLELLYRSFDDNLGEQESQELSQALAHSAELRGLKRRLTETRAAIADTAERSFKPFFAARVLQRTTKREEFSGSLVWAFRRVALAGVFALLLLIANNLWAAKSFSWETLLGMPQLTLEDTLQLNTLLEENK